MSIVIVQPLTCVRLFATPWTAACQASLSLTISQSLPKFMSTELEMPSNHLILCHPLLLPPVFSSFRVFSNELAFYIRWPKYSRFSFSISPSNEYSGLISFRIDWFAPLAVQETLKSLLQHQFESISSLVFSLLYGATLPSIHDYWKDNSFVNKVMSLFFNMLLKFVIAFLLRSKCLLISWLQSPSTVILEHKNLSLLPLFSLLFAMR